MTRMFSGSAWLSGAIAGLAGTATMIAMGWFDNRYAPRTMPKVRQDSGEFMIQQVELAAGMTRSDFAPHDRAAAQALHVGYGLLPGLAYALFRGHQSAASNLLAGTALGMAVYIAGYLGWMPLAGLTRPLWKQPLPAIAGEALRHVVYGVTTAAAYGAIDGRL